MWRGPYLDPIHRLLYLGSTGAVEQIINTNPSILGGGRQFVQGLRGLGGSASPAPTVLQQPPPPPPPATGRSPSGQSSESGQY